MLSSYDPLLDDLTALYGEARGADAFARLAMALDAFRAARPGLAALDDHDPAERVTERDVMLITYGDSLRAADQPPLQTLHDFLLRHVAGTISAVHVLPFFPYSSDDGFSVIDYTAVDPALGTWADMERLGADFKLMFDAVINHISAESDWFRAFQAGDPAFRDYFIVADPAQDLSRVVRPRTLPLLTAVNRGGETVHVWTTFSDDQIDLNFGSPDVLLRIIDVLLTYVAHGASFIRLDAIAYLWKEPGTTCIHLEQTHRVVRLFRSLLDAVAPSVAIITETNVPHAENISYFGDGANEAQLVYQFTLPPLMLHAFISQDATRLSAWAATIQNPSPSATYFNFTASHDGIGVRPVEDILPPEEVGLLLARTTAHGGAVSYKDNPDGTRSPYELNITYFDALSNPAGDEPLALQAQRFIASQAIQLAFVGMPGIYVHSLLGSRNWAEGVAQTGRLRSINREKLDVAQVEAALVDPASLRSRVFTAYRDLIAARVGQKAFHPNGPQTVLNLDPALFALLRTSPDGTEHIVAVHNVTGRAVSLDLGGVPLDGVREYEDLIAGQRIGAHAVIEAAPYQVLWLKAH
ncbi:sugar phosphorylase [Aggregatilinea lenta]|uniref:sugar phosphorylase n=1 Tax=Aggregatilinea lenta TaxID=913108 RepID=UPI0013C2AD15|nr:sugar phosphorylase [Aggregatilinea lenta]